MKMLSETLVGNGNIIRERRLATRSLTEIDRMIIENVRNAVIDELQNIGQSPEQIRLFINEHEMRGDSGEYGMPGASYEAIYAGTEVLPNGMRLRTYHVDGCHPLRGSTVSVVSLVNGGIIPTDINGVRLVYEYVKEVGVIGWYQAAQRIYECEQFIKELRKKIVRR